ncbi:DNA/RNA non-specific endonuclease [Streptomyces sp. AK08-02]|uniref:DNA/RNA non-specific endonuclease n=1 Tax=Streptomyces sp. AK08-02 TaxID=3028654 RepID=UPI0029BA9722|nr:DNA/RNA non-specific endonuclease [Streptomyces sp. AK08-02]MDX3751988.1 DNA/RNA non-specific endonuclease [Streptomyces sp. AK08-02]
MHGIPGGRAATRRARSTVLTVLTALTLVTTAATSQAAEPSATTKAPSTTKSAAPSAKTTATSRFAAGSGEDCTATAPGSEERRAGAVESCVTVTPAPAKAKTRAAAAAPAASAAAAAAAGSCDITSPGNYGYERFSYCVTGINVTYILRNSNGVEIGRGVLAISTGGDLSPTATTWNEQVSVTMTLAQGDVKALNAKFRASCDAGCTATKTAPWFGGAITLNQTLTGNVTFSSAQTAGSSASFYTAYAMYVTSPGATATDPNASWKNSRQIRCDDAVGGTSVAGCAIPSITAELSMSTQGSDHGGAVAAYLWAQKSLTDRWGLNSALTRSTSGVAGRASSTCGSGASEPFADASDLIPTDTCAQFPFAETKEGGRDGAECAQLIPYYGSGGWVIHELNGGPSLDTSQRCVRAHVAAADKQFADGQLANGFAGQRVIDADQFKLTLTTSLDGSYAECLGISPPGARPAGNGWILNTTEAVPHVRKNDGTSAAGYRATKATACLGKVPGPGSEAGGEITGWLDAADYASAHHLTEQLARCHLVANILGGRISKNLVPCWQVGMNTGAGSMWEYEEQVRDEVRLASFSEDDAIFYEVTPRYTTADSTIPVGVTISAKIEREDGSVEPMFGNVYIPNTQTGGAHSLGN